MLIDSRNWRKEAPELFAFDLSDPTGALVAADYVYRLCVHSAYTAHEAMLGLVLTLRTIRPQKAYRDPAEGLAGLGFVKLLTVPTESGRPSFWRGAW